MKVLLINPGFDYETKYMYLCEPLGILYLSSYIKKFGDRDMEVEIMDAVSETGIRTSGKKYLFGLTINETIEKIKKYGPDIIGIGSLFSLRKKELLRLAEAVKKKFPNIKVVAGGIYPTIFPEDTLASAHIDYVIIGEGEDSFLQLLSYLNGHKINLEDINGIGFKRNNKVFIIPKTSFIEDIDSIPFPDRESINFKYYLNYKMVLYGLGLKRSASIITSRSCPNGCSFCSMHLSHGRVWRGRSPENVIKEIVGMKEKYDIQELFIMDDNFSFDKQMTIKICNRLKELKLGIRWNTPNGISARTLDGEIMVAMKESGCTRIAIAVESGDEQLRNKVIGKNLTNKKIEEVVKIANKIKLPIVAFYIVGMIRETEDSFQETLKHVRKIKFNAIATSFATPLPGTQLYDECIEKRYICDKYDYDTKFNIPIIETPDFSLEEVEHREKRIYWAYLKSHFFLIVKDAILGRNDLFKLFFLKRIFYDKILKFIK